MHVECVCMLRLLARELKSFNMMFDDRSWTLHGTRLKKIIRV